MDIELLGDGLLNLAQEAQGLLLLVAGLAMGPYLAGCHIQGKQSGSAVADVVMCDALHMVQSHRQQRLSPIQSLDLGLLVEAGTIALSGGFRCPDDALPFSTGNGSVDT